MPTVTVIIPTHNRAGHLGAAIDSVLSQTFRDLEIIVVDDASSDDTESVVNRYREPRLKYLRQAANRGVAAARNVALQRSSSPYIAFLDDDDQWMAGTLSWQLAEFEKGEERIGLVFGGREIVFTATGRSSVERLTGDVETLFRWSRITTSTVMLRREGIEEIGLFDESMPCGSDYDLWIRLWRAGFRFAFIDRTLVRYFVHGNRLSSNPRKRIEGTEKLLEKHAEFYAAQGPVRLSARYRGLGLGYFAVGDISKARRALAKAFRLRPTLSTWTYYLLTFAGSRSYRGAEALRALLRRNPA